MNTTIIIVLAALILIVVIAIIVILIKGRNADEGTSQKSSPMSFQEKNDTKQTGKSEMSSPQLHKTIDTPTTQPPIINDLSTPQQTPSVQPGSTPPPMRQTPNIQQPSKQQTPSTTQQGPNPLPKASKIDEDLAKLQGKPNSNTAADNSIDTTKEVNQAAPGERIMGDSVPPVPQQKTPSIEIKDDVATDNERNTMNTQKPGYSQPQQPQSQTPTQSQETTASQDVQNQGYNPPTPTQSIQNPPPQQPQQNISTKPPISINIETPDSPIQTPPQDNPIKP